MSDEVENIRRTFQTNHIVLPADWLTQCVEWLKEENGASSLSTKDLHCKVYEQWLLLDFNDIGLPVLPRNVTEQKKLELEAPVCLQMMSVIDISKPKLLQIQKIRNCGALVNNPEESAFGKRVLQLRLTDGVQEILATEYKPVECLSLNLTPGIKVRLNAPITVRRGQVMLEPGKISLLGGEVDKILVSNAAENVLAGLLGLSINPNPVVMEANFENADHGPVSAVAVRSSYPSSGRADTMENLTEEEERRIAAEMDLAMTVDVPDLKNIDVKLECSVPPDLFQDNAPCEGVSTIPTVHSKGPPAKPKVEKSLFEEDFDEDEYEEMLQIENEVSKAPPPPKTKAPMTIEKLNALRGNVTKGIFRIQAQFSSIVEKLALAEDSYRIVVDLEDDTGHLTVVLHTDVISDMFGCSPRVLWALKEKIKLGDPTTSSTFLNAVNGFKNRVVELDQQMDVLLEACQTYPVVIKLL